MESALKLLDKWMRTCSLPSDNAAAKRLGIARQAISRWRHHETRPEPAIVSRMAEECGLDPLEWMARVESERARSPEDRKAWERVLRRFAATLAICTLGSVAAPQNAIAAAVSAGGEIAQQAMHYAQWLVWRVLRNPALS